jgi:predicted nucleic acid-binding protein
LVLAEFVTQVPNVPGGCADPDDDKGVAAALEGRAAFIVTGDRQFLALGQYENVRVVSPRAFMEILGR